MEVASISFSHQFSVITKSYLEILLCRQRFPSAQSHPKSFSTNRTATMRLPYIPDDPQMENKEDQDVVERVKERRGGKLIALDKALLHARKLALASRVGY